MSKIDITPILKKHPKIIKMLEEYISDYKQDESISIVSVEIVCHHIFTTYTTVVVCYNCSQGFNSTIFGLVRIGSNNAYYDSYLIDRSNKLMPNLIKLCVKYRIPLKWAHASDISYMHWKEAIW